MRFTLRRLMFFVFVASVCAFFYSWHAWYNHEIARFELNNGYSVRFWTEYQSWRGPRRQFSGGIYKNGKLNLDLSIPGKHYAHSGQPPEAYFADSNNLVYIRYPGPYRNYIVGDLDAGEFTSGMSIQWRGPEIHDLLTPSERLKWETILNKIQDANLSVPLRWDDAVEKAN